MIQLKSCTKSYNKTIAVDDVSFTAPANNITGLVGLNGAGKTTILKAIAGIHYADSGTIHVNGIDVLEFPQKTKKICGFISEQAFFNPNYKVYELLETEITLRKSTVTKKEILKTVKKLLLQFSLTTVYKKKIKELSKGYRQRLSFARALCSNPLVLLL
ncbi:MAG TPA: ABC transporter ATP-binding protein, partial [Treponemataceae bacterium]|nr:ABC transporter ATP-binding protein [Treponemataceae bacterium]